MDHFHAGDDTMKKAMQFAASPEANQLKALLQQENAQGLRYAMEQAAAGNLGGAKAAIEQYLTTDDGKALLEQLRKNP